MLAQCSKNFEKVKDLPLNYRGRKGDINNFLYSEPPLWSGLWNLLSSSAFCVVYVKWCTDLCRERTIKIVLNKLDSVDQATGFVYLCARYPVDFQEFKESCIFFLTCFSFLSSLERSVTERILTVTRTA